MKIIAVAILLAYCCADFVFCCKIVDCAATSCISIEEFAKECVEKGQAYVLPNGKCNNCCGYCADVKDVIDPKELKGCDPTFCQRARCAPGDVTKCTQNQAYAPRDGKCICCPRCANKKRHI